MKAVLVSFFASVSLAYIEKFAGGTLWHSDNSLNNINTRYHWHGQEPLSSFDQFNAKITDAEYPKKFAEGFFRHPESASRLIQDKF